MSTGDGSGFIQTLSWAVDSPNGEIGVRTFSSLAGRHDHKMPIDGFGLRAWFDQYFDVFAACVRGEREIVDVLRFYGVPVIMSSQRGVSTASTDDEAAAIMLGEIDALRAARYHRTLVQSADVNVINATSALYTATYSHRDRAGDEIDQVTITYLVTETSAGLKISVRAVHG